MEINTELMNAIRGRSYTEAACSADTASCYRIYDCFWAGRTEYCDEVVIAESPVYGKVLFLDKEIQSAESDEAIYHEHLVHPALHALAGRKAKRILIVGGGEGATAREVLKWSAESVAAVDWVDIDSCLVELCRRHLSWADDSVYNDPRLRYFGADIREFWTSHNTAYDLIILDLPDPDVDALHGIDADDALYSTDFMKELKAHLAADGAFVSHCGPVAPGGDPSLTRAGLTWITQVSRELGFEMHPYHTFIPSFQSEWGFTMSVAPRLGATTSAEFPTGLAVMEADALATAFHWPVFWNSPYLGFGSTRTLFPTADD